MGFWRNREVGLPYLCDINIRILFRAVSIDSILSSLSSMPGVASLADSAIFFKTSISRRSEPGYPLSHLIRVSVC